jgi:superfamily I DNA/RNA helicase
VLYRFKGQQAPAVILADVEPEADQDRMRRLLYCGMTRATVRLELMVNVTHPMYASMVEAAGGSEH